MILKNEKYIIDSNSLMTPFNNYYPFDFAPKFWEMLRINIEKQNIILLDSVKNEVAKGNDELTEWLNDIPNEQIQKRSDEYIINKYSEVMEYIQTCGYYTDTALRNWAKTDVADAWLIAAAQAFDYIIVTFEKPCGNLSVKNKSKNPKIPDVAEAFGVKCTDLFDMMRKLDIKLF